MNTATQSYNELGLEIEALEVRIKEVEKERNYLRKRMYDNAPSANLTVAYGEERVNGGFTALPLDVVLERLNKIDDKLDQLYGFLEIKKDARDTIDKIIRSSEDLDKKIVFMRDYKNMRLGEIAEELGYSHEHVRRISSRNKKTCHIHATHKDGKPL